MEEFRKICAGMTGAPEIVTKINDLNYTDGGGAVTEGVNCLQIMSDDLQKLNKE